MRKKERIDEVLQKFGELWKENAQDWRFGQLIINFFGALERDPWFYEEDEMIQAFEDYWKSLKGGK